MFTRRYTSSLLYAAAITFALSISSQVSAESLDELTAELARLKKQMSALEAKISNHIAVEKTFVAQKEPANDAPSAAPETNALVDTVTQKVMDRIKPSVDAAKRSSPSEFNPATSLIIDAALSSEQDGNENQFDFRSAELALSANVDPFTKAYATIVGTSDGVEVEEAAMIANGIDAFTLKGGRFFADFGRLSSRHDHDLPFVNRPVVLDEFLSGEPRADGVEASYLVPASTYLNLTLGAYDQIGAENDRSADDEGRHFSNFTYLGRAATYFDIADSHGVDLGGTAAITPENPASDGDTRSLFGIDATYRYTPLAASSYRGFTWGTELLFNREPQSGVDDESDSMPVAERENAFGLYSYGELKLTKQWSPGFLFDYAQSLDDSSSETVGYSPYVTFWLTEYQRLRLQYSYFDQDAEHDNRMYLQWTAVLGSHAHGFRDR